MASTEGFLAVARVVGAHGIRGEVRCELITDFPDRLKQTTHLYRGDDHTPVELERARLDKHGAILKLASAQSRDEAAALRGELLYVAEADAVHLPEDSYFWHQIIGLSVRTDTGEVLGRIAEIMPTGSNDVYVVEQQDRQILLPAIKDVVQDIDLEAGVMTVHLIEGLV